MMNECEHNFSRERQRVLVNVCCKCGAAENIVTIATQQALIEKLEGEVETANYYYGIKDAAVQSMHTRIDELETELKDLERALEGITRTYGSPAAVSIARAALAGKVE